MRWNKTAQIDESSVYIVLTPFLATIRRRSLLAWWSLGTFATTATLTTPSTDATREITDIINYANHILGLTPLSPNSFIRVNGSRVIIYVLFFDKASESYLLFDHLIHLLWSTDWVTDGDERFVLSLFFGCFLSKFATGYCYGLVEVDILSANDRILVDWSGYVSRRTPYTTKGCACANNLCIIGCKKKENTKPEIRDSPPIGNIRLWSILLIKRIQSD